MTKESKPSRRFEKEGLQVTRVYTQIKIIFNLNDLFLVSVDKTVTK